MFQLPNDLSSSPRVYIHLLHPPTRILSMFTINPDKEVKPSLTLILASFVDVQSGYYVPDAGG